MHNERACKFKSCHTTVKLQMLLGGNGAGVHKGMLACIQITFPENQLVR